MQGSWHGGDRRAQSKEGRRAGAHPAGAGAAARPKGAPAENGHPAREGGHGRRGSRRTLGASARPQSSARAHLLVPPARMPGRPVRAPPHGPRPPVKGPGAGGAPRGGPRPISTPRRPSWSTAPSARGQRRRRRARVPAGSQGAGHPRVPGRRARAGFPHAAHTSTSPAPAVWDAVYSTGATAAATMTASQKRASCKASAGRGIRVCTSPMALRMRAAARSWGE
mmetsp:Transcript_11489/g.39217  ORF Transcript_11489/g.39217 Transcript_11489/m.39217 type:complete len:224 (-) Transcript_11489:492-1163(-)